MFLGACVTLDFDSCQTSCIEESSGNEKNSQDWSCQAVFPFLKSGKSWNLEYVETMSIMRNLDKILKKKKLDVICS